MNYTQNYHLPQWALNDRIMMDDFNQMCASLENGLTANRDEARQKTASLETKVAAAQAAAELLPYAAGTYTGTGQELFIQLGFRPRFIIISGMEEHFSPTGSGYFTMYTAIGSGRENLAHSLVVSDTGFSVYTVFPTNNVGYPSLSASGRVYDYIAFR